MQRFSSSTSTAYPIVFWFPLKKKYNIIQLSSDMWGIKDEKDQVERTWEKETENRWGKQEEREYFKS